MTRARHSFPLGHVFSYFIWLLPDSPSLFSIFEPKFCENSQNKQMLLNVRETLFDAG